MEGDVSYCMERIAEEERLASDAGAPEAAEKHHQMAMLYKAQLNLLTRRVRSALGDSASAAAVVGR